MPVERLIENDGITIRCLDNDPSQPVGLPVVFVPGITDVADDYLESFDCFADRRWVVVELRGRGGSTAPPRGYSAREQAGDVCAVMAELGIGAFHLMTFSRGTTPGLQVAFLQAKEVRSVSIGDYRPAEIAITPDLVERLWSSTWRGTPVSSRVARHALDGIQADAQAREFWDELAALNVPVLVARGSEGGIVTDALAERYRDAIPDIEVVTIPGSAHDLFRPSRTAYPNAVLEFIGKRVPGS